MQPEIGKIYDGKVTGITKFGAFVEIEDGVSGMVHISEIANTYVNEISEHVSVGDEVKVRILKIAEDGKISMSIKQATPLKNDFSRNASGDRRLGNPDRRPSGQRTERRGPGGDRRGAGRSATQEPQTPQDKFEDMLSKFKSSSDEKLGDFKKTMDSKRRNAARRRGQ